MYFEGSWTRKFERAQREEKERRGDRRRGVHYRFAVGFVEEDKPGVIGYKVANAALEALGGNPSLAFVAISKRFADKRSVVLKGITKALGELPLIGGVCGDFVATRDGLHEGGVAVALWSAEGEDLEISSHLVKIVQRDVEEVEGDIKSFLESSSYRYTNVIGTVPFVNYEVGNFVERVFLNLSEYVDLAVIGVLGESKPSPWSIIHGDEFFSNHISLITVKTNTPFGVFFSHGFHPLVPMEITRVEGLKVLEIDGSPAHEVLLDLLVSRGISGKDLKDPIRLKRILTRYQVAVADPAAPGRFKTLVITDIGHEGVLLNSYLNEGDTVWLMEADYLEMAKSTSKGALRALSLMRDSQPAGLLFFEDLVRILALGEKVTSEVDALKKAVPFPFLGISSSQEIVLHPSVYSGLQSGVSVGVLLANAPEHP